MRVRETIDAVKEIPAQIRFTFVLAMTALIIGMLAMAMTIRGGYRAN